MAGTTATTAAGALKQVYDNNAELQQNLKHRAIDELAKSLQKYNPGGQGFYGSAKDYGNESGGAINESEQFRTIDSENFAQWKVSPKTIVWPVEFSGLIAKSADSDDEAFVSVVVDAIDSAKERLLKDANRQFYGLGTGLLASPTDTVASDATSFTVASAQYLRANMVIDIFSGATETVSSWRIQQVDKVSNIVYGSVSMGVPLNSTMQLVKENIRTSAALDGKEAMGLRGIVDDSTDLTTFQNISAATNRIWRSRVIAASSANLTSDLLQRLLDDVEVLGGEIPDTIIMHNKQQRKYLDIILPQKRYQDKNYDAGFKKLEFNGTELWLDTDCQHDVVYAINKKYVRKFELAPLEMGVHGDSGEFLRKADYDSFQAYWRWYVNFGTSKRTAHGKISGLATPTGVS